MSDKIIENNQVTVIGSVASEFTYSHEVFGEGFYMVDILVKRLSNSSDRIPVMVSERLIDVTQDYKGRSIMVSGQFRSYNRHENRKQTCSFSVCTGNGVHRRRTGRRKDKSYLTGRIYVQDTGISKNPFRT